MIREFSYIIVLLENTAASFCYYENPGNTESDSSLISLKLLKKITGIAKDNNIALQFLYGNTKLPAAYEKIIEATEHVKIAPLRQGADGVSVKVINGSDLQSIDAAKMKLSGNVILRIRKNELPNLYSIIESLIEKVLRINLVLVDVDSYSQAELEEYKLQLGRIEQLLNKTYIAGKTVEFGPLSDRLVMREMNNCNAGINHITLAPNGKFYICPAFYYENPESPVGDLSNGVTIKNEHLLKLDYAPICRNCDAFQCKRCLFLNKRSTLEINTPSRQQCVSSHFERDASGKLLDSLRLSNINTDSFSPIPHINYTDPFDIVTKKIQKEDADKSTEDGLTGMSDREILLEIYRMQKQILNELGKGNK